MNILPKKKWHVRTKENIARVNRDEAQAAEEERLRAERESLAEKEFRTKLLRDRAAATMGHARVEAETRPSGSNAPAPTGDVCVDPTGHVNFFADLEAQERTFGKNKEAEKEKTREKEEYEQKMGILRYLGEGSAEYMKDVPWYQKKPARQKTDDNADPKEPAAAPAKSLKTENSSAIVFPSEILPAESRAESRKRKHSRKSKKDKKKKKKKSKRRRKDESSEEEDEESGPDPALEELRKQRLKREADEIRRQRDLLRKLEPKSEKEVKPPPAYVPRYNSQFNPEFARQNVVK